MTTYSRPGVYVDETLNPLSNISSDPSDAVAAFVGVATGGGPIGPILVNSWSQYQALFGGIGSVRDPLAYALHSFFNNGGGSAFIVRAVNDDAAEASVTINGTQATPAGTLTLTANAPGTWASDANGSARVFVTTQPTGDRFDLIIEVGTGGYLSAREQFVDLSMDPADPRYAPDYVNSPVVGSKYVLASNENVGDTFTATLNPAAATKVPLTGGSNGTGTPDLAEAVARLDSVDRNLVVNVPEATLEVVSDVIAWAQESGRHFVVADVPQPADGEDAAASVTSMTTFLAGLPTTSHVAAYGPWVYTVDPASKAGALRLTAPGGAVVGQYLRTDNSRGVFKAPAGVQTSLTGVVQPYLNYSNVEQDSLAAARVNLIKHVPGSNVCIMGARTKGGGYPDRYVPVRRLLISLKSGISNLTRFALFENNNEDLWSTVEDVVGNYLMAQYELGAFKGSTPNDGFYVVCDDTINSASDIDAGIINIEVGVALNNPAEFIVIRLGQTQAGLTATDNLE